LEAELDLAPEHAGDGIHLPAKFGMSPSQAIQTDTTVAAEIMGWQNKTGSIAIKIRSQTSPRFPATLFRTAQNFKG